MALTPVLAEKVQLSAPGTFLDLFDIDLTPVNQAAGKLYFYPGSNENASLGSVPWLGNTYLPMPIEISNIEYTGKGAIPRPTLTVSNVFGFVSQLIGQYGTIGGIILTRWQTFTDYLDNGPTPTADGHLPVDVYFFDRIAKMNKVEVQIEMRSALDYQGVKLPVRQVIRDACGLVYRVWNATAQEFNYTNVTCPYVGSAYFDATGTAQNNPALDVCSKQLDNGCLLRFTSGPVPFGGFPGVQQFGGTPAQ